MEYFLFGTLAGFLAIVNSHTLSDINRLRKTDTVFAYGLTGTAITAALFYDVPVFKEIDSFYFVLMLGFVVTIITSSFIPKPTGARKGVHETSIFLVAVAILFLISLIPYFNNAWGLVITTICLSIGMKVKFSIPLISLCALIAFVIQTFN